MIASRKHIYSLSWNTFKLSCQCQLCCLLFFYNPIKNLMYVYVLFAVTNSLFSFLLATWIRRTWVLLKERVLYNRLRSKISDFSNFFNEGAREESYPSQGYSSFPKQFSLADEKRISKFINLFAFSRKGPTFLVMHRPRLLLWRGWINSNGVTGYPQSSTFAICQK